MKKIVLIIIIFVSCRYSKQPDEIHSVHKNEVDSVYQGFPLINIIDISTDEDCTEFSRVSRDQNSPYLYFKTLSVRRDSFTIKNYYLSDKLVRKDSIYNWSDKQVEVISDYDGDKVVLITKVIEVKPQFFEVYYNDDYSHFYDFLMDEHGNKLEYRYNGQTIHKFVNTYNSSQFISQVKLNLNRDTLEYVTMKYDSLNRLKETFERKACQNSIYLQEFNENGCLSKILVYEGNDPDCQVID